MFSALRSIVASLKSSSKRQNAGPYGTNASRTVDSLESRQLMTFSFGAPILLMTDHRPTNIIELANVDGDGDIDLVVGAVNGGANSFERSTVMRNDGGTRFTNLFKTPTTSAYTSTRQQVQIVDVTEDGIPDILFSNMQGIHYRRGHGNGDFAPGTTLRESEKIYWLAAELNGNQRPDFFTGSLINGAQGIKVEWDNGAKSVTLQRPSGADFHWAKPAIADVNRDSRMDVIVHTGAGGVYLYRQLPGEEFAGAEYLGSAERITSGDVDGDGFPELLSPVRDSARVRIWWNRGNGTFSNPVELRSGLDGSAPVDVAVADLNGDGLNDIITANRGALNETGIQSPGDSVSVLMSAGSGNFSAPVAYIAGTSAMSARTENASHPATVRIADVTGDGILDAVVGHDARADLGSVGGSEPVSSAVTILPGRREEAGLPDLHAVGMTTSTNRVTLYDSYAEFSLTLSVRNSGTATAPGDWAWRTRFYISKDAILDDSDHYASAQFNLNPIAPGGTAVYNTSVSLPAPDFGYWSGSGPYYILAKVDSPDSVLESNESNNWGLGIGIDVLPIDVRLNRSAPVIAALSAMELWPGQTIARRSIQATDADGDAVSLSAQAVSINWHLDQKYNFRLNGSYSQNTAGMNEKWIWSDVTSGWFFITPQGQLFERTNPNGSPLTFHHVIDVSPAEHADPALLHDARRVTFYQPSAFTYGSTLIVNANTLTGATTAPFAVIVSATDGERSTSEGFAVTRANSMAERLDQALNFGHRTSYQTNVLGQNEKLLSSSAGWHYITPNGQLFNYTSRKFVAQLTPVYYQHPQLLHNANVFQLDQQYGLYRDADNYAPNATGRKEKWLGSSSGQRYFLLSNGDLYRWNGQSGPAAGTRVSSLGSSFYTDPRLLHDAQARTMDAILGLNYRMTLLDTRSGLRFKLFTDRNGQSYRLEQDGRFIRTSSAGNEELTSVDRLYYDFPTLLGDALN